MILLYDTLATTSMHGKYWVNGGLLLGCVRDGGPLPGDDDVDFSFWAVDRDRMIEALRVLENKGFCRRKKRPNNDRTFTKWSLRFQGVDYDFIQMEDHGSTMRWISHAGTPGLEILNEVPNHGLKGMELYDRQWMIPDDPDTYLQALYGDWRHPDPNYCFWDDSQAVIKKYPRIKHPK